MAHQLLSKIPGSLRAFLKRISGDRKGASAILTAVMLPMLVGFIGLAIDVGVWQINKRKLQGAADQAAYSAAVAAYKGANTTQATNEAKAVMAQLGFTHGADGVTISVSNPASSGNYSGNTRSWQVSATKTQKLFFSGVFNLTSAPTLAAKAVALQGYTTTTGGTTTPVPGAGCILTLDTAASYSTEVTNNGAVSTASCAIYTNSASSSALGCYNNCNIASNTFTVGNYYKASGSANKMTGTNLTAQAAVVDPLAALTTPTAATMGSCTSSSVIGSTTSASRTINPGRYCGGINFTGAGKTLIMNAGTYYVESIFNVGTGATLNATATGGVTIVIVGSYCLGDTNNTCEHPDEGIGNIANINITAPTTGTYKGVAMYFSNSTYRQHQFANNSSLSIQGALYAPNQKLSFNNNSTIDNTKCMKIISRRVTINNNGAMSNDCAGTGVPTIGDTTTVTAGTSTTVRSTMVE